MTNIYSRSNVPNRHIHDRSSCANAKPSSRHNLGRPSLTRAPATTSAHQLKSSFAGATDPAERVYKTIDVDPYTLRELNQAARLAAAPSRSSTSSTTSTKPPRPSLHRKTASSIDVSQRLAQNHNLSIGGLWKDSASSGAVSSAIWSSAGIPKGRSSILGNGPGNHRAAECPTAGTPKCYNCQQEGHVSRECPNPQKAKSCYKCGEEGHLSRECPQAQSAGGYGGNSYGGNSSATCYQCNQVGHISRNCPQKASGYNGGGYGGNNGRSCYTCGGVGHLSRDCTSQQKVIQVIVVLIVDLCFNCGNTGHISRDCTSAPQAKSCYQCGESGHISRDCPQAQAA
ncbi:hypothetical protein OIO90_002873 [Microbotryomycetes sp. JL221]|nr:hypothetical protein OIO90_002873 [Microbotryomycetes sp. JL221]